MQGNEKNVYLCRMDVEKKNIQMRKGVIELCILSLVSQGDMYSTDLLYALKKEKLLVAEGTVYPLLTRLKNEGLLKYRWEESRSGPPRKYYALTGKGSITLEQLEKKWNELTKSVNIILKNKRS